MHTTKNWGSEWCDVLYGGPEMCQSVTGGGESKLVQNSATYFMDGPLLPMLGAVWSDVAS